METYRRYDVTNHIVTWRFDGDNLTITKLCSKEQIKASRKYNARLFSMISHDDGLINYDMLPIKDLAIGISHFCRV